MSEGAFTRSVLKNAYIPLAAGAEFALLGPANFASADWHSTARQAIIPGFREDGVGNGEVVRTAVHVRCTAGTE